MMRGILCFCGWGSRSAGHVLDSGWYITYYMNRQVRDIRDTYSFCLIFGILLLKDPTVKLPIAGSIIGLITGLIKHKNQCF